MRRVPLAIAIVIAFLLGQHLALITEGNADEPQVQLYEKTESCEPAGSKVTVRFYFAHESNEFPGQVRTTECLPAWPDPLPTDRQLLLQVVEAECGGTRLAITLLLTKGATRDDVLAANLSVTTTCWPPAVEGEEPMTLYSVSATFDCKGLHALISPFYRGTVPHDLVTGLTPTCAVIPDGPDRARG